MNRRIQKKLAKARAAANAQSWGPWVKPDAPGDLVVIEWDCSAPGALALDTMGNVKSIVPSRVVRRRDLPNDTLAAR